MTSFDQPENRTEIRYISEDFDFSDLDHEAWKLAHPVSVNRYWSGEDASPERHFAVSLLWSSTALYALFRGCQFEPLVVADYPDLTSKTDGLWTRDVFEIFVAPSAALGKYFEFEVAPTGEWIDLEITPTSSGRKTDLNYRSGMKTAASIYSDHITASIIVPWDAFGGLPAPGDIWMGNLFRIIGRGKSRGYLSWQATSTREPNFHIPEKFGEFEFVK